jgi:succinoglycan biosynthesis protein ExoM
LINASILSPQRFGLSFDTNMAFTGGSDSDFFMRLVHAGGSILHVSRAIVREVVLPNRLSISWRLTRQYRSSTNRVYINTKLYGRRKATFYSIKETVRHLIEGTLGLIFCVLFLLSGYQKFKRHFYHSLRHLAKGAGNFLGLFGAKPQPYQHHKIDGY